MDEYIRRESQVASRWLRRWRLPEQALVELSFGLRYARKHPR